MSYTRKVPATVPTKRTEPSLLTSREIGSMGMSMTASYLELKVSQMAIVRSALIETIYVVLPRGFTELTF